MSRWEYTTRAGKHFNNTLVGLLWDIVTHRWWQWRRGDGWID